MGTPKKKIKFLEDVEVLAQGEIDFSAKAGEVVELSANSANRWLRRNLATAEIKGSLKESKKPVADEQVTNKRAEPLTSIKEEVKKEPAKKAVKK